MGNKKKRNIKITIKQEKFAAKYVLCNNAAEAYRFAYSAKNMNERTVWRQATYVKNKPIVAARIQELRDEVKDDLLINEDTVLREFARIGFSDPRNYFDDEGRLIPVHKLSRDAAAAISSIKVVTRKKGPGPQDVEYVHDVRLWPKNPALENLSKNLGLFERDNKQKQEGLTELARVIKGIDEGGLTIPAETDEDE